MIFDYPKRDDEMKQKTAQPGSLAAFQEATMKLENTFSLFAKHCGLSDPEYWSLLLIEEGIVTQSEISELLYISRQTLNSAFKQLVKKGLIRLEPYADNQRTKQAILTEKGKDFFATHISQMQRIEETAWEKMQLEERIALTSLMQTYSALVRRKLREITQHQKKE